MDIKTYTKVTGLIFLVIAVVHLLRAILGWPLVTSTWTAPVWLSWIGFLAAAFLAYQGLKK